jgi:uncharacterized protein (DUF924 family)
MKGYHDVIDFWFQGMDDKTPLSKDSDIVKFWFARNEATDQEITKRFKPEINKAVSGAYDDWLEEPEGRLALIIIFDQFPRNIYRGTAKAFDYDLIPVHRQFAYLPLMHSELIEIQEMSLKHYGKLVKEAEEFEDPNLNYFQYVYDYAQAHYDVIKRFKRYPHRNAALGRRSTSEERQFIEQNPMW